MILELFVIGFLVTIVAQTVLYLVCKSHHQETVDLGSLSAYLGASLSDPQPISTAGEVIQLGRPQNESTTQVIQLGRPQNQSTAQVFQLEFSVTIGVS
ncbi:hypothetical protein Tco_0639682 [Tanacetum coccineum]